MAFVRSTSNYKYYSNCVWGRIYYSTDPEPEPCAFARIVYRDDTIHANVNGLFIYNPPVTDSLNGMIQFNQVGYHPVRIPIHQVINRQIRVDLSDQPNLLITH